MSPRRIAVALLSLCFVGPVIAFAQATKATERLDEAATAFEEIMRVPDKSIPRDLLSKAECVAIVPGVKKGAFIVGANYGRGFVTCRKPTGWSAPGGVKIEGGSVGFQIGGSETDVFMLVMNERGADKLLSSEFTLGGDASAAAGPVGRSTTAQTDATMHAEILSWSRARGVFAGVSLQGATLRQDNDANMDMYGTTKLENREIVKGPVTVPKDAKRLIELLKPY